MSNHITLMPYVDGVELQVCDLFQRVFHKSMTPAFWRWKFKPGEFPFENVWHAYAGGLLVAQFAGIPTRFHVRGAEVAAIIAVDAMVDPSYRQQGIMTRLALHARAHWTQAGIALGLALPNEKWGSILPRIGWPPRYPLSTLYFPVRPDLPLLRRLGMRSPRLLAALSSAWAQIHKAGMGDLPGLQIKSLQKPAGELDQLWASLHGTQHLGLVKDKAWLAWLYFDVPGQVFHCSIARQQDQPAGFLALSFVEVENGSYFHIADLFSNPSLPVAAPLLALHAVKQARTAGVKAVIANAVPGTQNYAVYRRLGFIPRRRSFTVAAAALAGQGQAPALQVNRDLHLCSGDFDVV